MKIIGFTGGTGCGKTTALHCLDAYDAQIFDCDAIYHGLLASDAALTAAIGERFPGTVRDGVLDRKALGTVVFRDPTALEALSAITDPVVERRILDLLAESRAAGRQAAAIDAIRLFESGISELCDVTIAVTAPEADRVRRLMAREGLDEQTALTRIRAQQPNSYFVGKCDYTLENAGDLPAFQKQCKALLDSILETEKER